MPPPLDVDRDQVKMLVQEMGCTEAAKRTGVPLNTVLQWSSRFGWLKELRQPRPMPASMTPTSVIGVIKPADALQTAIQEHGTATKLSALRYARKAVEHAEQLPAKEALAEAQNVKAVLQGMVIADGSGQQQAGHDVRIAIFAASQEPPALDI